MSLINDCDNNSNSVFYVLAEKSSHGSLWLQSWKCKVSVWIQVSDYMVGGAAYYFTGGGGFGITSSEADGSEWFNINK